MELIRLGGVKLFRQVRFVVNCVVSIVFEIVYVDVVQLLAIRD